MAAHDAGQSTLAQIIHIFHVVLFYTNCSCVILIPVRTLLVIIYGVY